jgi:hypothetical protein
MTDNRNSTDHDQSEETPDTSLNALQRPTAEYTLDNECIAVPKGTVGYLIEELETQALGVRKHGDPEHYEALCHRVAELRHAYHTHRELDDPDFDDQITITVPGRALGLVLERAKMEYHELSENQGGCNVDNEFLADFSRALTIVENARTTNTESKPD